MKPDIAHAPFDPDQVKALKWFQRGITMAPYTCQSEKTHKGERPVLLADTYGLTCPECGAVRESVPAGILEYAARRLATPDALDMAEPAAKKRGKR